MKRSRLKHGRPPRRFGKVARRWRAVRLLVLERDKNTGNNILDSGSESDRKSANEPGGRITVLFLSAFGDDSADETMQRVFSLACVVATDEVWKSLEEAWVNRTGGVPFHSTDCDSNQGVYRDKSHADNKALYRDLVTLLAQSGACGWGVAVDLAGHREFFPDVAQDMQYQFGLSRVVEFFMKFAEEQSARQLKISLDNRLDARFNAAYLYSLMINDETQPYRERMSDEVSFLCSAKNPRIQMGDLFARECMKHLDNIVGPVKRIERKSMTALVETKRFGGDFYTREYFADKKNKWAQVEKAAGFSQGDYVGFLKNKKLIDNMTSKLKFMQWLDTDEGRLAVNDKK